MGEGSEWIEASEGCHALGSCEAHHVGISPQEDRRRSEGKMGEVEAEESCLDLHTPYAAVRLYGVRRATWRLLG
jgi:hypothetical protein